MDAYKDTTVVIQAGGRSSRMGQDKGLLSLAGRPMIEHVIDRVAPLGDELLITTSNPAYNQFGLRTIADAVPGAGALPGLLTALKASTGHYVIVVACDMPFLNTDLLRYQRELAFAEQADIVVPRWDDRFQTLHAVHKRESCLVAVERALEEGEKRMRSFYIGLDFHVVEPDIVRQYSANGQTFVNINTPEELAAAERMLA